MPKRITKRVRQHKKAQDRILANLPEGDLRELAMFREFLKDKASMPHADLIAKHAAYLGLA